MFQKQMKVQDFDDEKPPKSKRVSFSLFRVILYCHVTPGGKFWRTKWNSFCDTTSCHGIPHIHASTSWTSFALWALLIGFSVFAVIQQLNAVLSDVTRAGNQWSTNTFTEVSQGGGSLHFPKVTVCNLNLLQKSKVEKYNMPEEAATFALLQHLNKGSFPTYPKEQSEVDALQSKYSAWKTSMNWTYSDILYNMGHTCEDTMRGLKFGWSASYPKKGEKFEQLAAMCNNSYWQESGVRFETILSEDYGRCFQLVFNDSHTIDFPGFNQGIMLTMDNRVDQSLSIIAENTLDSGFMMQLSVGDAPLSPGGWIAVTSGTHTWVSARKIEKRLISGQDEDKMFGWISDLYAEQPCKNNQNLTLYDKYTYERCTFENYVLPTFMKCNCTDQLFTDRENVVICEQDDPCPRYFETHPVEWQAAQDSVVKDCQPLCTDAWYDFTISANSVPTENQIQDLIMFYKFVENRTLTESAARQVMSVVTIYFRSLEKMIIETRLKTSVGSMLSNIGGQMGLWLGVSVITVEHLIISACSAIWERMTRG